MALTLFYVSLLGYLLGSIPFGLLLTKVAGLGDIRQIGSGNIGATNVLRTGNKPLAALTLLLDGLKGAAAVLISEMFFPGFGVLGGWMALLGHVFPVWLKGKGGKGVATTFGVITALYWPIGVTSMVIWFLIALIFRYSSFAALLAIGVMPVEAYVFRRIDIMWLAILIVFVVFTKHGANIERLLKGTEPKIGGSKAPPPREN